jgi:hypothetical protein
MNCITSGGGYGDSGTMRWIPKLDMVVLERAESEVLRASALLQRAPILYAGHAPASTHSYGHCSIGLVLARVRVTRTSRSSRLRGVLRASGCVWLCRESNTTLFPQLRHSLPPWPADAARKAAASTFILLRILNGLVDGFIKTRTLYT